MSPGRSAAACLRRDAGHGNAAGPVPPVSWLLHCWSWRSMESARRLSSFCRAVAWAGTCPAPVRASGRCPGILRDSSLCCFAHLEAGSSQSGARPARSGSGYLSSPVIVNSATRGRRQHGGQRHHQPRRRCVCLIGGLCRRRAEQHSINSPTKAHGSWLSALSTTERRPRARSQFAKAATVPSPGKAAGSRPVVRPRANRRADSRHVRRV